VDWLRISLLLLGVILVAGIWVAHRLRTRARRQAWEPEPEDWDEDDVHIRAHRDEHRVEPGMQVSGERLNLPDPDDDVSPVRRVPRGGGEPQEPAPQPHSLAEPEPDPAPLPPISAPPRERKPAPLTPQRPTPTASEKHAQKASVRPDPRPQAEFDFNDVSEPRVVGRNPLAARGGKEKILILHVVAPRNRPFTGVSLRAALKRAGLEPGEMAIYHYHADAESGGEILFSVSNMVAPGTLSDEDLADLMTPGITLFFQVHACEQPHKAFEALLETSHVLARDLGGSILDAQQSTATNQTLAHMREEMNQWLLHHRPDLLRRKAGP
jgi:cell division protein ZipA